jgi:hypothetical protein
MSDYKPGQRVRVDAEIANMTHNPPGEIYVLFNRHVGSVPLSSVHPIDQGPSEEEVEAACREFHGLDWMVYVADGYPRVPRDRADMKRALIAAAKVRDGR